MPITLANAPSFKLDWHRHAAWAVPARAQPEAGPPLAGEPGGDADFVALQEAYRPYGGLVRAEALAACMTSAGAGGYVALARALVGGQLFSFEWHHAIWLPLFQLDAGTLAPRAAPQRVLDELREVLDGWALARWHVQPHAALGGRCPLDLPAQALPEVLAAARADRARLLGTVFRA